MKIKSITYSDSTSYDGYTIKFDNDKLSIKVMLSNGAHCCEEFYIGTTQNIDEFIGKEVETVIIEEYNYDENEMRDMKVFIKIKDYENLIITLFNKHNGYYSHNWFIHYKLEENDKLNEKYIKGIL